MLVTFGASSAAASEDERLQLWQYRLEEPTKERWIDPHIYSVQWKEGDLEVLFTMTAPCGWMPVDPDWTVQDRSVILRFSWSGFFVDLPAAALCKKYVRAWVFRVPNVSYRVSISKDVPRFAQRDGHVVILNEPK